jgi:hypothetical protein
MPGDVHVTDRQQWDVAAGYREGLARPLDT